ncbi:hypothetical protein J6590_104026 [Homalodisca vitripennis]|nr:hypothetical protein J6590_104026 [Homalodisca vitripennis]
MNIRKKSGKTTEPGETLIFTAERIKWAITSFKPIYNRDQLCFWIYSNELKDGTCGVCAEKRQRLIKGDQLTLLHSENYGKNNRNIRDETLLAHQLSLYQHAYVQGNSVTTALRSLVEVVEDTFKEKEALVSAFMNIEEAFGRVAYESMEAALKRFEVPTYAVKWIVALFYFRKKIIIVIFI